MNHTNHLCLLCWMIDGSLALNPSGGQIFGDNQFTMKLAIIGGGSVRTPRLIPSLVRRAERLGLEELWLMDSDSDKLRLIGGLCQVIADQLGAQFKIVFSDDARQTLTDTSHLITSIRPGKERGRAVDEHIAFEHGVLGQETTGAAGFAMAMRSLPAIMEYKALLDEVGAPNAWLYNFTNPAGLVAQGLHDAGYDRVIGICDSANGAQHAASRYLGVPLDRTRHTVYGLNHLSWTRSVRVLDEDETGNGTDAGEEVLPSLLGDENFIASTHMQIFDGGLRQWQRAFMNEYLHYFYHRDEALKSLLAKPQTRGEEVWKLTENLIEELTAAPTKEEAVDTWRRIMGQRSASYFAHARNDKERPRMEPIGEDDEGYAGVALGCIEAIQQNIPLYTGLNVPNNGTIHGLRDDDVVEVSCWIDANGVRPIPVTDIQEDQLMLMRDVKQYERLASRAIRERSRELAVQALTVHPLIGSYPLAGKLVDAFLNAHRDITGEWGA